MDQNVSVNQFLLLWGGCGSVFTVLFGIVHSFSNHLIGLSFPHLETLILGAHESVTLMKRVVFWVFCVLCLCR